MRTPIIEKTPKTKSLFWITKDTSHRQLQRNVPATLQVACKNTLKGKVIECNIECRGEMRAERFNESSVSGFGGLLWGLNSSDRHRRWIDEGTGRQAGSMWLPVLLTELSNSELLSSAESSEPVSGHSHVPPTVIYIYFLIANVLLPPKCKLRVRESHAGLGQWDQWISRARLSVNHPITAVRGEEWTPHTALQPHWRAVS